MFKHFIFVILFFFNENGFSQNNNHPHVKLIEKQDNKRLKLFAKNTDTVSYSVFLRVTTSDFRRSSNRPVITTISPKSEKHLITLIKLAKTQGVYDYKFIVNKYTEELSFTKDRDGLEQNFNEALNSKTVTIYEVDNCQLCSLTKEVLTNNNISFKSNNISNNKSELFELLKMTKDIENESFILKIEDSIYSNIKNKEVLIKTLKNHFPEIN